MNQRRTVQCSSSEQPIIYMYQFYFLRPKEENVCHELRQLANTRVLMLQILLLLFSIDPYWCDFKSVNISCTNIE